MSYADTLGRVMNGDYDEATPEERAEAVREIIQVCSVASGALAIQPIPLLDMVLVIPVQVGMVQGIGRVYGHSLDRKAVIEIMATFGAGIVAQNVMIAAAKFVPFAGWIAAAAMSYALTFAIGEVSDHYFKTGRGVAPEDLKTMFKKVYREKKQERESGLRGSGSLKERLEQLTEARAAGLITEEEFEAKKQEILGSF